MSQQTLIEFETPPSAPQDRVAFEIGWDHARHGLVPCASLMATPMAQGWHAARAVFGQRTLAATRHVRQWLRLRLQAWQEGAAFEGLQVTPHYLSQIDAETCPVTRRPLGGPDVADEPLVARLRQDAGYAAGHLVVVSRAAWRALVAVDCAAAIDRAERLARDGGTHDGLDAAAWARLAALTSFAVALPQVRAARVPLRALPPNRVRVLSAAQGLQVLLTLRLAAPGWSRRARAIAELLPAALRHDFNLFVGAIAPRLLAISAEATPREQRWAQEDAWADARVQRRWQHFAVQLGEAETEALLARIAEGGLGGVRCLVHGAAAAVDGWGLGAGLVGAPRAARGSIAAPAVWRQPRRTARSRGLGAAGAAGAGGAAGAAGAASAARPPAYSAATTSPSAS